MRQTLQAWGMAMLRMAIGWHFLYEGLWKLAQPGGWSSAEYLRMSRWIGAPLFHWIAGNQAVLNICDQATMWGLTLIGLGLITGVLARVAAPFGILLLAFFYVAQPPFLTSGGAHHFLLLDYNVVEAFALAAVMFNPGAGLWEIAKAVCARLRSRKADSEVSVREPDRRDLIAGLGAIPVAAAFGGAFVAKHGLDAFARKEGTEAQTSASYRF